MSHPLAGAFLRFQRADKHLAEADSLMRVWEQECVEKVIRQEDGQYRFNGFADIPPMLPVVVGDVVHNLRAALDYLVYELSIFDSDGRIKNGTQFPIEDVKSDPANPNRGFDVRRKSYLKGLNQRHADAIERLQPYNGVGWTETLREISNPDKHRHLCVLTKEGREIAAIVRWGPEGRFGVEDLDPQAVCDTVRRFDLELDGQYTVAIALPKKGEVALMPTLRRLEADVCGTLELFKPEF